LTFIIGYQTLASKFAKAFRLAPQGFSSAATAFELIRSVGVWAWFHGTVGSFAWRQAATPPARVETLVYPAWTARRAAECDASHNQLWQ